MGLLDRLLGRTTQETSEVKLTRGPKSIFAEPGSEDVTFRKEASNVLGRAGSDLDFSSELQADYGCDELEVIELIQIAEDLWNASLMPKTFGDSEIRVAMEKFKTLDDIVNEAKTKAP